MRQMLARRLPTRRAPGAGFTLLEVMIAVAILSMTLVVLLEIVTNNLRATKHAKLTTAATLLAGGKMIDLEDQVLENGFSNTDETANGTFKEQGHGEIAWDSAIERVELPVDAIQKQKDEAHDKQNDQDSANPMSMLTGFLGGMMSSFIEPVRLGLQESVRRVTVHVTWQESGRPDQSIEVVEYLTDPSKLDAAMGTGAGVAGGAGGTGGAASALPGASALSGALGLPGISSAGSR
jgi:prepilin-type N-terminal cleavage/methylation domain-containing protein